MQYLHVKNLEKYHPGYKDRQLHWAKIYFDMVHGDPECQLIENEIDWARLLKFIILELKAKKPIPLDSRFLRLNGFDLKKRPISLTLKMLHNFVSTVTQESNSCVLEESRVEKSRVEESRGEFVSSVTEIKNLWNSFCDRFQQVSKVKDITETRKDKIRKIYKKETFKDFQEIVKAIEEQDFLLGNNDRKWKISFDWLISNDTNHVKVIERRYKDDKRNNDDIFRT